MGSASKSIKGFTLIELMIVVAIMAIIVALAVPAYRNFTIRAKVAECVSNAAPVKTSISEFKQTMGVFPVNMDEAGIYNDRSNNISSFCEYYLYNNVRGANGDFAVEVDMAAVAPSVASLQLVMVMSPVESISGAVDWYCTRGWGDTEALKFMPASCRGPNIYN
jgi:type IV pilus assembly protein PilA